MERFQVYSLVGSRHGYLISLFPLLFQVFSLVAVPDPTRAVASCGQRLRKSRFNVSRLVLQTSSSGSIPSPGTPQHMSPVTESHLLIAAPLNVHRRELHARRPNVTEANNMTSLEAAMSPQLN
jgi:hypothetical protein